MSGPTRITAMGQDARVWLIGEHNPHGVDPRYALYPAPRQSAGGRLCHKIFGMSVPTYLKSFRRFNLVTDCVKKPKWDKAVARTLAQQLVLNAHQQGNVALILLGEKVTNAFGFKFDPFFGASFMYSFEQLDGKTLTFSVPTLMLPHPSGRSRLWNDKKAIPEAREALAWLAPHLTPVIGEADPCPGPCKQSVRLCACRDRS